METKRHIPGWAIIALVLAVALAAIVTIATLRQQADEGQQAVILLSHLELLSNKLGALEYRFEERPKPEVLEEIQAVESQLAQTLDGLTKLDPGDGRLQRLGKAQLEFESAMNEAFRLIAAGDFEKAEALDEERVDPALDLMSGIIADASVAYSEKAQQAQRASDVGTVFIVITAGTIIGFLSLQFQKMQLRAESIAIEQNALRKAHDELEMRVQERTAELTKSEGFLDSIFTSIQDGVGTIDKDMNIIRVNPTVEKWYSHVMPLVGKKCYEAYHGRSERCEGCPAHKTLRTGESAYGTRRKIGTGGENVGWIEIYSFPMLDTMTKEMRGVIEYVRDITERRQVEEERELLLKAVASSTEGIAITDEKDRYVYINAAHAAMHGYSQGELIGKTWRHIVVPEIIAPSDMVMPDTLYNKSIGVFHGEYPGLRKDGTTMPTEVTATALWDEEGNYQGHICIVKDITERKLTEEVLRTAHDELELRVQERTVELVEANKALQAEITERERTEESLKQSEEKYHTLVENIQDGVFIIQDAKIQFVNEALTGMTGYTAGEIIGMDFRQLVAPEDLEMVTDRYYRRLAGEDVPKDYELRLLHKDGRTRVLTNMNIGLINYRGKVSTMGTLKDITEKKKLEAQLLRAQRMESIGTLAGGIAHDLNNVLTPMMLSLQILQEKFDDEQSQKLLSILETNTQRGANLIKQVMSFVRGIEGERTALQIAHIIAEIEKIAKETFPRSIEIRTNIQRDLPTISGDATQLHQVIMNLCVNARDAMLQGGTLGISAEYTFVDESYVRTNLDASVGPFVTITVTDKGTGISPDILSRIFEPFFTTKEFGKGTGLGLSTALGIVKGHGGFIDVSSEVGKGTSFKVYLPAAKVETQKAEVQQHELPSGHEELVFVVDDESEILEIAKVSLEKYGYRVLTANDGEEAIRLYSQNKDGIKVILMDMMMPVMDGPASIKALREINPTVKIIGVSGLAERDKIMEDAGIQVHAFLTKPYTTVSLLRTIRDVLSME